MLLDINLSNTLLLQWCSGDYAETNYFPITFSSEVFKAFSGILRGSNHYNTSASIQIYDITLSSFKMDYHGGYHKAWWLVIGT